jgi:hypothetical protein
VDVVSARPKLSKEALAILAAEKRALFFALLTRAKLPLPQWELKFDATRRWRLDYAWPDQRLALEVEGGVWTNGRHTRGAGFLSDVAKYNRLACMGWRLLRCTPDGLHDPWTITQIRDALSITPLSSEAA